MKESAGDTNNKKRRHSLLSGISFAGEQILNLSGKLSILFAGFILTLHAAFLLWGSVLLWHSDWVWLIGLVVAVMDVMLVARICRPAKSVRWWYAIDRRIYFVVIDLSKFTSICLGIIQ